MDYVYSLAINFPNGLIESQLMNDIIVIITTPMLYSINTDGDVVTIQFASAIPDQNILNNIIANYTYKKYNYITPYIDQNIIKNTINNVEYDYMGKSLVEIIISTDSQSNYNTLSAAVAANNADNLVFVIYPGVYYENNPIILKSGSTVKSLGDTSNTTLVAINTNQDFIVLNKQCKLEGLTIYGASDPGSRGIYFDGSLSNGLGGITMITECFIIDCNIGIECDGKNVVPISDTLYCDKILVKSTNLAMDKGIYCHSGGQFITTTCYINSSITNVISYGYYCVNANSKISLAMASAWFCNVGLYINDSADSQISLLNIQYNNIGAEIGPIGTITRLSANSLIFRNSTTYDLSVNPTNANIEIYSSFLDDSKIHNPNSVNMAIKYNANKYNNYYQTILGDLMIGSQNAPSKLGVGEGIYIHTGVAILSNNNLDIGTWIDNTSSALSGDSTDSFNLFQSTAADNCMYIGAQKLMYGFKIEILTATTTPTGINDVIFEYWNGAWTQFTIMQMYPTEPTNVLYTTSFISNDNKYNIRFGLTTVNDAVSTTLNGYNKYWIRLRLNNAISNIPVGNYVKIHSNSLIIKKDGYTELMGNARCFKALKINTYPCNSTPGSQEIYVADNLSVQLSYNVFTFNTTTRIGFKFKIPIDIDISFPIKINLNYIVNDASTGNISWTLRYVALSINDNIYLNQTDAQNNPNASIITSNKITSVLLNTNNKCLNETFLLNINSFGSNPSSNDHIIIIGSIERASGTDVNDTYLGNVVMTDINGNYIIWADNGHILGY